MRCRRCQYVLLNLAMRECPECGEAFAPSDYAFVPGAVRFCCPQCDQAYYGTDGRGLPVPRSFACVSCHRELAVDDLVVRPLDGATTEPVARSPMPWLDGQRSWWRTFLPTAGRAMVEPRRIMKAVPPDAGTGRGWTFALLTLVLMAAGGIMLPFAVVGLVMLAARDSGWTEMLGISFGVGAGVVVTLVVLLALWGLITHGLLRLTGGTAHPIGRTYQALCFSSAPMLLAMVPCLGPYLLWMVGAVWWIVCAVLMVASGQKVHGGRASFAVLVAPMLAIILGVGSIVASAIVAERTASQWVYQDNDAVRTSETQLVLTALSDWAFVNGGTGPSHPLLLMADGSLSAWDFIASDTNTVVEDVPLGDVNLGEFDVPRDDGPLDFDNLDAELRDANIAPIGDAPARVGDFVFTYAGIPLPSSGGPEAPGGEPRWVLIMYGAPEAGPHDEMNTGPVVGFSDGTVETIPWGEFDARLWTENQARTAAGLPDIPWPATLRHAERGP